MSVKEDLRWLTGIAIRQIVDLIPVMIGVMKPDGVILYANKTVLGYTGFSIDDAMALLVNCVFLTLQEFLKIQDSRWS